MSVETKFPHDVKIISEPFTFSGRGKVWSFTIVYQAPSGFEDFVPYTLAIIKLEEGPMITAQLTDLAWHWESITIDGDEIPVKKYHVEFDMPVEMVTKLLKEEGGKKGLLIYGYKFRPRLVQETNPDQSSQPQEDY